MQKIQVKFKQQTSSGTLDILKLAATLRFLAEGSYQKGVGQNFLIGIAQPTVSVVMSETLEILESKLCPKFKKFEMGENEKKVAKEHFYQRSGFSGVILCVDGTHVSIISPSTNEHHFYNRKGFHSMNAMMACDHNTKIHCVNASYGGSAHDSVVWSMSAERVQMESNFKNRDSSKILGDSGYALEPWMMTPYRAPDANSPEANYNTVHSKCRSIIVLEGRFRCLLQGRELHYRPEKAARIINVCAMLHNVCLKFRVPFDEELFIVDDNATIPYTCENLENLTQQNMKNIAKNIRDQIKNSL